VWNGVCSHVETNGLPQTITGIPNEAVQLRIT
jgi:hypothetical protein